VNPLLHTQARKRDEAASASLGEQRRNPRCVFFTFAA
jgi:hypothetical protein